MYFAYEVAFQERLILFPLVSVGVAQRWVESIWKITCLYIWKQITQTAWWHGIVRILWASLHLYFLFFFHLHLHALPPSSPPPTTSTSIQLHAHLHLYLSLALVLSFLWVISLAGWFREARLLAGSYIPCPKRGYIIFFWFNLKSHSNLCTEAAIKPCLFSRRMKI